MVGSRWTKKLKKLQIALRAAIAPPPRINILEHSGRLQQRLLPLLAEHEVPISSDRPMITAVIPVRLLEATLDEDLRRIRRIALTIPKRQFDLVIVDDGSPDSVLPELARLAEDHGITLVETGCGQKTFSIGRTRDAGVVAAKTPFVMFHDIDFIMDINGYLCLIDAIERQGMPDDPFGFFAVPGAYLSSDMTRAYLDKFDAGDDEMAERIAWRAIKAADRRSVENFTMAISAIVARRSLLIGVGGHDRDFVGHGAEDFELMHRLAQYSPRPPLPRGYRYNLRSNQWRIPVGFRAYFAKYGRPLFDAGVCFKHLWHAPRGDAAYFDNTNQQRISQYLDRWLD